MNAPLATLYPSHLATLRERLPAPCLGVLPHGVAPAAAAAALDTTALTA